MRIMVAQDIIDLLPIVATPEYGWHIRSDGCIRGKDDECPVCALFNEILNRDTPWERLHQAHWSAIQELVDGLGISGTEAFAAADAVANAADANKPFSRSIREKLCSILLVGDSATPSSTQG